MKIDKEFLEGQIDSFNAQREQLKANVHATEGALQLCEHLLKVLDMEEPQKEESPDGMAKRQKKRKQKGTSGE